MRTRSTSGAQIHLKLYTSNASANAEMDLFWMPASERRLVSVAASIAKGNPEDMPRKKAASGADSKYGRAPRGKRSRQDKVNASVFIVAHQWCHDAISKGCQFFALSIAHGSLELVQAVGS